MLETLGIFREQLTQNSIKSLLTWRVPGSRWLCSKVPLGGATAEGGGWGGAVWWWWSDWLLWRSQISLSLKRASPLAGDAVNDGGPPPDSLGLLRLASWPWPPRPNLIKETGVTTTTHVCVRPQTLLLLLPQEGTDYLLGQSVLFRVQPIAFWNHRDIRTVSKEFKVREEI